MKHRGPGSSRNPAREAARAAERARSPVYAPPSAPSSALIGAGNLVAHQRDGWTFGTDPDGNLTASYRDGPPTILAFRDTDPDEENQQ